MPFSQTIDVDLSFHTRKSVVAGDLGSPITDSNFWTNEMELKMIGDGKPDELEELEDNMAVTSVKVEQNYGLGGWVATVESVVPRDVSTRILKAGTEPDYAIDIHLDLTADFDDGNVYDDRIFTGVLQEAKIDEENVLTIEFMDKRELFNRYRVQLDTREEGETSVAIIRNLLGEEIGLAEGEDFVIDIADPVEIKTGYGTDSGEAVGNVIRDIAEKQGAAIWVDEYNTIHFEDFEERTNYTPLGIISFNAGEQKNDVEDVIVSTNYDDTGINRLSGIASNVRNAGVTGTNPTASGKKRKLTDNNITPVGAQNKAESRYKTIRMKADSGTIEIIGDPRINPLDRITLIDVPRASSIAEGEYTVKKVTHKFDGQNGYTTVLMLTVDMENAFADLFERNRQATNVKESRSYGIQDYFLGGREGPAGRENIASGPDVGIRDYFLGGASESSFDLNIAKEAETVYNKIFGDDDK